jgi:DNA-binding MarR family transcriptional regulator
VDSVKNISLLTALLIISITDDMTDLEDAAARLRAVVRLIKRRAQTLREKNSPTPSEQSVLVWLDDKGAISPRALADIHQVRPQTMQQTLDSLEGRRWIKRADHPTDRRQILFSLSHSGRKALLKGRELRQAWLVAKLGELNPHDRKTVAEALHLLEGLFQDSNSIKTK